MRSDPHAPDALGAGDRPPEIRTPPPGPRSRELSATLAASEAPGVNTLVAGAPAVVWEEAAGANVLDVDGNRYLDLTSGFGVAAVGHRHPAVAAAVHAQAERLLHGLGDVAAHPARIELARRLAAIVPVDDARVYFAISGADAVEIALKSAVLATGRPGVLAFAPAYHGVTLGALAASSREAFRRPFSAVLNPHVRRLPYGAPLAAVEAALISKSGEAVGAILVEPVVGREGVIPPPPGWLPELAEAAHAHGALLVADEIFTGFGRTGDLFAVDSEGVRPDLLCCGKALGGGLPIAAAVGRAEVMAAWETGGEALHTATHLANPLACAAALAVLDVLAEDRLPERAQRLGLTVGERLAEWPKRHPAVTAVRGRGLLWGIELVDPPTAHRAASALLARGVIALAGGAEGRVLQIVPPLTIAENLLDLALEIVDDVVHSL